MKSYLFCLNKYCMLCLFPILTACSALIPGLEQTVETIADDDAISIKVYKEAITQGQSVHITADIIK